MEAGIAVDSARHAKQLAMVTACYLVGALMLFALLPVDHAVAQIVPLLALGCVLLTATAATATGGLLEVAKRRLAKAGKPGAGSSEDDGSRRS